MPRRVGARLVHERLVVEAAVEPEQALQATASEALLDAMHRARDEPGADARRLAQAIELAEAAREGVLHHVLHLVAPAQETRRDRRHAVHVTAVERLLRPRVARPRTPDELFVGHVLIAREPVDACLGRGRDRARSALR